MPRTCFVIGPIGEPGSPVRIAADDFMKYIVTACPALNELGYADPIRADQLNEPGRITSQIVKLLMEAELVIADLTENNANVYYELSLRHAIGKPVIHMAHEGTVLSFDVRDNRTIFYTMHSRVAEVAREELSRQIRKVSAEGYRPSNPILETVGLISLEKSSEPQRDILLQLSQRMANLEGEISMVSAQLSSARSRTISSLAEAIAGSGSLGFPPPPGAGGGLLGSILGSTSTDKDQDHPREQEKGDRLSVSIP